VISKLGVQTLETVKKGFSMCVFPNTGGVDKLIKENAKRKTKIVPKGTSSYQAAWIVDEEGDEDEEDEDEQMDTDGNSKSHDVFDDNDDLPDDGHDEDGNSNADFDEGSLLFFSRIVTN